MATKTKKTKTSTKKHFKVFVSWEMSGSHVVEAETQEDAENMIDKDETPLPENGDYVGGSCQVNREFTLQYNEKEKYWEECQN